MCSPIPKTMAAIRSDLYAEVASIEKVAVPNDDMAPFTVKLDGAAFASHKFPEGKLLKFAPVALA